MDAISRKLRLLLFVWGDRGAVCVGRSIACGAEIDDDIITSSQSTEFTNMPRHESTDLRVDVGRIAGPSTSAHWWEVYVTMTTLFFHFLPVSEVIKALPHAQFVIGGSGRLPSKRRIGHGWKALAAHVWGGARRAHEAPVVSTITSMARKPTTSRTVTARAWKESTHVISRSAEQQSYQNTDTHHFSKPGRPSMQVPAGKPSQHRIGCTAGATCINDRSPTRQENTVIEFL